MTCPVPLRRRLRCSIAWATAGVSLCVIGYVADTEQAHAAVPATGAPAPWSYAALAVLAVAGALWPVVGLHRMQRLARRPGPAFAMHATVTGSGRGRVLHLYPLDAAPAAPAVCSVPVIPRVELPDVGSRFPIEVKGTPRPLGRVAVRAGTELVWTTGRALTCSPASR